MFHFRRDRCYLARVMEDTPQTPTESLLPYDAWTEQALRAVVVQALRHTVANGLPGEHHFYVTFRTDYPGVTVPARLLARYPQEMTIVLQHQFWDLAVAEDGESFTVALSFGGVPATLVVPMAALVGFADPHVRFGLRFTPPSPAANSPEPEPELEPEPGADPAAIAPPRLLPEEQGPGAVVSLDKFRRRKD